MTLTPTSRNSSYVNLARHGHRRHAPLTFDPDTVAGEAQRRLLDVLEECHCWHFADLVKRFPAPNNTWDSDAVWLSRVLRGLKAVGEVSYDSRRRTWRRTP